ncbi:PREDICTED: limb region 1 protein homolog [Acropora digitifera]|uniref:limb region 1 protein homolog n=1 Tax=Acropora digitifera TaxID=70779 RepID=UPI00077A1D83|nr:PREDICTED: limb region 1 protein homolog [Acropora digitifera]
MESDFDGSKEEQVFNDTVREYVISLLCFIVLYGISHVVISAYKRKRDELDSDEEDAFVYRISFWLCNFTLTVSLGAVLLLPMSIFSNEIMIMYPNSYYIKWLNGSLIHGMWNQIFLGSYMSLFVAIPFAYFFTESEGFAGSRKGIKARVYETFVVLFLLAVLVTSIVWVVLALIDRRRISDEGTGWIPGLPFVYSCISLIGGLMLLHCLFLCSHVVLRDLDDEISAITLEEESLKRKMNGHSNGVSLRHGIDNNPSKLKQLQVQRQELERSIRASPLQRNCVYPILLLALLILTTSCMAMVALNVLSLLFVHGALPKKSTVLVLGKVSSSMMGTFGALLEIILIFYLMIASLVGLYSVPCFSRLRPVARETTTTTVIANCIVLLILSSALPALSRTLGITKFDLIGEFARLDWLDDFRVVILYNFLFEVLTAFCLVNKFTASVRKALYEQVESLTMPLLRRFKPKQKTCPCDKRS